MYDSVFRPGLFDGQVVVITGGGTGIGRAIAFELASLGARVVLASRRAEVVARARDEIRAAGGVAESQPCDIRDEAAVAALFDTVADRCGRLDGLVNNGGGQFLSPAEGISRKGWQAVVDTNLNGTFFMCQAAYARFFAAHGGAIVNIVAEMWRGFPGMAHTGAARAGVVNLTKTLAVEWAACGVRVNSVAPGVIDGNGIRQYGAAAQPFIERARADLPFRRLGTEGEVAAAVTFLLSPAAAYISGATLRVDGASALWRKTWEIPDHPRAPRPFEGFGAAGAGDSE